MLCYITTVIVAAAVVECTIIHNAQSAKTKDMTQMLRVIFPMPHEHSSPCTGNTQTTKKTCSSTSK